MEMPHGFKFGHPFIGADKSSNVTGCDYIYLHLLHMHLSMKTHSDLIAHKNGDSLWDT